MRGHAAITVFTETERFLLREIVPGDEERLFALDSDPEVHWYLGNRPIGTREQAREIINAIRQQYREHGIGRWAVVEKRTGEFMGWAGLKFVRECINGRSDYYDLGYRLLRDHWGRGIASECAVASLEYGFNRMNLSVIYACADAANAASIRVLEKAGLKFRETFAYDGSVHNWYSVEKHHGKM